MNEANKIRAEKIKEYKEKNNIPEFTNPNDYHEWLESPDGKKYANALEKIRKEVKGRGGKRPNAGRKKLYPDRVALNKRVSKDTIVLLKDYSQKHQISENEALDKLIREGYEHLEHLKEA